MRATPARHDLFSQREVVRRDAAGIVGGQVDNHGVMDVIQLGMVVELLRPQRYLFDKAEGRKERRELDGAA